MMRRQLSTLASRALVLNAGSSSLKYGLFELQPGGKATALCSGLVDKVGSANAAIKHSEDGTTEVMDARLPDHSAALSKVVEVLTRSGGPIQSVKDIHVVGHRVVHGGSSLTTPTVVDDAVESDIERCVPLAPLHNPANLLGIRVARELFSAPSVAVFDTAFHASIPPESFTYALPKALREEHGVRKYGFHGTSYTYVLERTASLLNRPADSLSLVMLHLGNGASMSAVKHGKCIDTTMGMTPLEGLIMGTRAGDLDPGALHYLATHLGYSAAEIDTILNKQSGLQGLCGLSDMRAIRTAIAGGDEAAGLARRLTIERIRKYLGSYLVRLRGDVDAIVFTGGIGENDADLREAVCEGLTKFGIAINPTRNELRLSEVQASFSKLKIMVVPTDEEVSIAQQAAKAAGVFTQISRAAPAVDPPSMDTLASATDTAALATSVTERPPSLGPSAVPPLGHAMMIESDLRSTEFVEAALLSSVLPRARRLGYFRLLSRGAGHDPKLEFLRATQKFGLDAEPIEAMYGMQVDEATEMFARGQGDETFDRIIDKFQAYAEDKDFVLVSGAKVTARGALAVPGSSAYYAKLAGALNIPALVIHDVTVEGVGGKALEAELQGIKAGYDAHAARLAGALVTGMPIDSFETEAADLRTALSSLGIYCAGVLPHDKRLWQLSMAEVANALDAEVLYGGQNLNKQFVRSVETVTMDVPQLIQKASSPSYEGTLAITCADRTEVLFSMLLAASSKNTPLPAGLLLTGADQLPLDARHVLDGLQAIGQPILLTSLSSFEAAARLRDLQHLDGVGTFDGASEAHLRRLCGAASKLEAAEALIEAHLENDFRDAMVESDSGQTDLSPMIFKHKMFSAARASKQHIVLPEGDDIRVVTAAAELLARNLCSLTLIGNESAVRHLAEAAHVDIADATIVDPDRVLKDEPTEWAEGMVESLYQAREKKGMTVEKARELLRSDPSYFGTMMMMQGLADGMVSGACHSTANTMRPALQLIKMAPGCSLVSSVFFMLLPDKVYVYGDCAINVDPDASALSQIALASCDTARAFGIQPRCAMLSYASGDSNTGPQIDKVREATEHAKELAPSELFEGPIQFDAAVDPAVAAVKFKGQTSPVAGRATVCIFPDLNSGNNAYKAVQQASHASAVGPIMQGLRLPVNDLSRGCTVEDIVNTVVCTALQARAGKDKAAPS